MYSREPGEQLYTFEASGGLLNAGLVMRDRETDSWWSIINEEAIHGPAQGERLQQVSGSTKTTWGDWKRRHPNTQILSVEGSEHRAESPYDNYFSSEEGFRKLKTDDQRLPDKEHIYAFHWQGTSYVVPHPVFREGGAVVPLGDRELFLYRLENDSFYRSTVAVLGAPGAGFVHGEKGWQVSAGDQSEAWDSAERTFSGNRLTETFQGFDTFWYIWSLTNPGTEILQARQ